MSGDVSLGAFLRMVLHAGSCQRGRNDMGGIRAADNG